MVDRKEPGGGPFDWHSYGHLPARERPGWQSPFLKGALRYPYDYLPPGDRKRLAGHTAGELKIGAFHKSAGGIFMGTEESLGETFNLFAAPEDVNARRPDGGKILLTFNKTVERVASLKNWHGFDGGNFWSGDHYAEALRSGKWFIPPRHVLHGEDGDGNIVRRDNNLYALRETGDFKGTFTTASGSGLALWYMSCTKRRSDASQIFAVTFVDGSDTWTGKDALCMSSRPVRAELRPGGR